MRWLFLIVLFLNLAYVGWQVGLSPADPYAEVVPLKGVSSIVLLSEMKRVDSSAVAEKTEEPKPVPEKQNQVEVEVGVEKQQDVGEIVEQKNTNLEQVEEGEKVVAQVEKVSADEPVAVPTSAGDSPSRCFTLGPFRNLDKLSGLTQEIKPYVVSTDFRASEKTEPTLYWVYIKPEKSYKRAVEVGNRLKTKKIKDFYVIRDGEKINGLSLGHFRSKGGAYGLTKKVKNLGFDVQVEQVYRSYTLYWLDYQLVSSKNIPASVIDKYIKSSTKKEKISRQSRDCVN